MTNAKLGHDIENIIVVNNRNFDRAKSNMIRN